MPTPSDRDLKLVAAVAAALAEYQGVDHGNIHIKAQVVEMLIANGTLSGYKRSDFLDNWVDEHDR
jgi:bacillopeptidase F (M6 metalloprotease family)